uniref:Uncharacterized protein n=1 Tax=Lepeophtheirus salmonis TaxID=72036 RepID=A0A0K2SYM6_LEPSM
MTRPLPYPYTFGAQVMQFPFKWMWKNNIPLRLYVIGAIPTFVLFNYITYKHPLRNAPKKPDAH